MVEPSPSPPKPLSSLETDSAPAFPRERLTQLLGEAEAARERRFRAQVWLVGLGLVMLALGAPGQRLWGEMELVQLTAGSGERSYGILFPLAVALKTASGISAEQACFLIAAISYGLCVPALVSLLRTIGFEPATCMIATVTAIGSAACWLGGTQPGDFAPGLLGATLLLRALFQPKERIANGYQWRATLLLTLAFLVRPENLLLFPAVAWAVSRHRGRGRTPGAVAGVVLALVTGVLLTILLESPGEGGRWSHLLDTLLAGRQLSPAALVGWLAYFVLGLGFSLFGIYALLLGRRLPEETPPPKWVVPWCLVALAPVAAGSVAAGPIGAYLVPAAAVGIADWLTRKQRQDRAIRLGLAMVGAQVLLTASVAVLWSTTDPLREWRVTARAALEPTDVVAVGEQAREYLLAQRWNLATVPLAPGEAPLEERLTGLTPELESAVERGERRLVIVPTPAAGDDRSIVQPGEVLHPQMTVWLLTEDGLVAVAPGIPYGAALSR